MAKSSSTWVCSECEAAHTGWFGRCPACGAWNTVEDRGPAGREDRVILGEGPAVAIALNDVPEQDPRLEVGMSEVDRVLGGGLVPGSVVLLGGAPGIGKSTLLLQVSGAVAHAHGSVVYASGEESISQVAQRAGRLGAHRPRLLVMAETRIEPILDAARQLAIADELAMLVVDSVQTVYAADQEGLPGNVGQIRSVAAKLISFAKTQSVPVLLVGHVTKDGQLAGPRVLEHMVDTVLSFEGDDERATRLLRASKNRFGSTLELGVFEMTHTGLREIANPSEAFLSERPTNVPGSCVTVSMQGTRPLLLEVQALLAPGSGGSPRRNCVGVDAARVAMLLAVLDRHGDVFALDHDVFVNVAGGMRLGEPAADLSILLAVASGHLRKALPQAMVAVGEIGLTGELRAAPRLEARLTEAARLGFERAVVPRLPRGRDLEIPSGFEVLTAGSVRDAIAIALA